MAEVDVDEEERYDFIEHPGGNGEFDVFCYL